MASAKAFHAALLGLIIALTWTGSITARAADDSGNKPDTSKPAQGSALDRFEAAVKSLKLTDEQKPKIDAYFETAHQEIKAAESAAPADRDKKMREISAKLRNEVGEVLTNEQKADLLKKMPPPGDPTDVTIERIKRDLNKPESKLTAEQKEKVNAVLDDTKKKLDDLKAEARESHTDPRAKMQEVLKDMQLKLSAILSPK